MSEWIGIAATVLAVGGCALNNRRRRMCFVLWVISNAACLYLHAGCGLWSLAVRDVIFTVLSVEGWILWNQRKGV